MAFEKGKGKTGGRQKGTPNKMTKEIRDLLKSIYETELEKVPQYLEELTPKERINFIIKISPFILPRLDSIDMEFGEPFKMWI